MISRETKREVTDKIEAVLKDDNYSVTRVDYRTINIRIPTDYGGHNYLTIQVKELI